MITLITSHELWVDEEILFTEFITIGNKPQNNHRHKILLVPRPSKKFIASRKGQQLMKNAYFIYSYAIYPEKTEQNYFHYTFIKYSVLKCSYLNHTIHSNYYLLYTLLATRKMVQFYHKFGVMSS